MSSVYEIAKLVCRGTEFLRGERDLDFQAFNTSPTRSVQFLDTADRALTEHQWLKWLHEEGAHGLWLSVVFGKELRILEDCVVWEERMQIGSCISDQLIQWKQQIRSQSLGGGFYRSDVTFYIGDGTPSKPSAPSLETARRQQHDAVQAAVRFANETHQPRWFAHFQRALDALEHAEPEVISSNLLEALPSNASLPERQLIVSASCSGAHGGMGGGWDDNHYGGLLQERFHLICRDLNAARASCLMAVLNPRSGDPYKAHTTR